MIIQSTLR